MTFVAILSVFAGMIVGIRFKVFTLIPVITVAMLVAATVTVAQGNSVWSALIESMLCAVGAQVGYLCGSFVPFVKEVPENAPAHATSASMPLDIGTRSAD